jgi:hypothetical protein
MTVVEQDRPTPAALVAECGADAVSCKSRRSLCIRPSGSLAAQHWVMLESGRQHSPGHSAPRALRPNAEAEWRAAAAELLQARLVWARRGRAAFRGCT